jgi:hypothetical protein
MMAAGAALGATIIVWLSLVTAVLPFFFRYTPIRRLILGKHYMEGTWIQAEKHKDTPRMAVVEIQPAGSSFRFSGYAVDENLEVQANVALEFSKFDWPFMTYKFRNTFAETNDEGREGVGEIHFEANRQAPRTYNGFVQTVSREGRVKIEGVRLTLGKEIRSLRSIERRADVIDKYWGLFFERGTRAQRLKQRTGPRFRGDATLEAQVGVDAQSQPVSTQAPVHQEVRIDAYEPRPTFKDAEPQTTTIEVAPTTAASTTPDGPAERRTSYTTSAKLDADGILMRRRSSDWDKEQATSGKVESNVDFDVLDDVLKSDADKKAAGASK